MGSASSSSRYCSTRACCGLPTSGIKATTCSVDTTKSWSKVLANHKNPEPQVSYSEVPDLPSGTQSLSVRNPDDPVATLGFTRLSLMGPALPGAR